MQTRASRRSRGKRQGPYLERIRMMLLLLSGPLALNCCAAAGPATRPKSGGLVGAWLMMADGVDFPGGCFSDLPIQYHADGSYSAWGEGGRWRLHGAQLVETAQSFDPLLVEEAAVEMGKAHVSTLQWAGSGRFWKTDAKGHASEFRRCPEHR